MTSGPRIRKATTADLAAVKQLVDGHRLELGFVPRPALATAIDRGWLLVAEVESATVGAINWWARRDGVVVLYNLVVDPCARHQGIGKGLLQALLHWARKRNMRGVVLKCPVDLPSNAFYTGSGFSLLRQEPGKRRVLNVWGLDLSQSPQSDGPSLDPRAPVPLRS